MIISLNWLKKYVDIKIPTDELVKLIGARLVEVEEAIDLAPKYAGAKIVKVVECAKIPDTHLSLCKVDDAGVVKNVERREDGLVQVVCGAPNAHAGMLAVWLPPKMVVPATFGQPDEFKLEARKLLGHISQGMLAAMDELDLGADHDGIVELDPNMSVLLPFQDGTWPRGARKVEPGDSFAAAFGLNDTLLDIENKSLTHRPDCFGIIGFAREVAGILGQPTDKWLNNPDAAEHFDEKIKSEKALSSSDSFRGSGEIAQNSDRVIPSAVEGSSLKSKDSSAPLRSAQNDTVSLTVKIDNPELCPRYQAVVLEGFKDDKPKYLTEQDVILAKSGMRPIDPIVDVTNYLMLLTGQPLHAFDYDKLVKVGGKKTAEIIVRAAKKGEKLELLDGKEIEMSEGDIVITSNNVPVALAGAMGGANTAIDKNTKRIVIESATFNLYNLRGTQFRHGIFSEAITRFTKGQPPALTEPVIREAVLMLTENCDMTQVSEIFDAYPKKIENPTVDIMLEQINNLLGTNFTYLEFEKILTNIGYKIWCDCGRGDKCECEIVHVQAPFWRTDIHIPEDVIEDIGRINGFDNIPLRLPTRSYTMTPPDMLGDLKAKIRQILAAAGANEVLTYSFVSEKLLEKVGQAPKNSYKIINSISPELQYVRQSLTPSLLEKTYINIKVPYDHFILFEINQVFQKAYGLTDENVPVLRDKVALVIADRKKTGDPYYDARSLAEQLLNKLGIKVDFVPLTDNNASNKPFEPKRSAQAKSLDHKICYGVVGELRLSVSKNLKLPQYVAGFELNVDKIMENCREEIQQMPSTNTHELDLTFQVDTNLEYAKLENLIREEMTKQKLWFELTPVSIYQGQNLQAKNISFRLTFASYEKTLTGAEITTVIDQITAAAKILKARIV